MKKWAVILPAGGRGRRMGKGAKTKIELKLGRLTLLEKTTHAFLDAGLFTKIIWALPPKRLDYWKKIIKKHKWQDCVELVPGGSTRQKSVWNALTHLQKCTVVDGVLIHDAVRPFIRAPLLKRIMKSCIQYEAVLPAVPVIDSIIRSKKGDVAESLKRSDYQLVQTPQAFLMPLIIRAHQKARSLGVEGTDDAGLVELLGKKVHFVRGEYDNLKVTTPADYALAKLLLKKERIERA